MANVILRYFEMAHYHFALWNGQPEKGLGRPGDLAQQGRKALKMSVASDIKATMQRQKVPVIKVSFREYPRVAAP